MNSQSTTIRFRLFTPQQPTYCHNPASFLAPQKPLYPHVLAGPDRADLSQRQRKRRKTKGVERLILLRDGSRHGGKTNGLKQKKIVTEEQRKKMRRGVSGLSRVDEVFEAWRVGDRGDPMDWKYDWMDVGKFIHER